MKNTPGATDVKVFVPTKDFQLSLQFYTLLGWKLNWNHENGLAELELADKRLFLQNYYQKDWANNFMLYINVGDAQAWFEHVEAILKENDFGTSKVNKPKEEAYGALVTYVWDPCGVLLHFAQPIDK